jgi:hypothetical protein
MATRPCVAAAVALIAVPPCFAPAATIHTTNFAVTAPTEELARQFGEMAEHYRKVKAIEWLGEEMPNWQRPCPLQVTISMEGPSGATTFDFSKRPIDQFMQIKGPKERLLNSVLPHEITHTVFAYYFKKPVPRWADEGGAVLSEDDIERARHDKMCRQLLNAGHAFKLHSLFSLSDYPHDVMVLYAEGFSVVRFLVESSDRPTFLKFVKHGLQQGWDNSVQTFYRYHSVSELEQAWIENLRNPRSAAIAANTKPPTAARGSGAALTGQTVVRTTTPPALPDLGVPSYRGNGVTTGRPSQPLEVVDNPPPPPLPPPPIHFASEPVRLGMPQLGPLPRR